MLIVVIAYTLGIFLTQYYYYPKYLILTTTIVIVIAAFVFYAKGGVKLIAIFILSLLVGLNWATYRAHQRLQWSLPQTLIKKPVLITGTINSLPKVQQQYTSFIIKTDSIALKKVSTQLRITWYDNKSQRAPLFHVGERWRLVVKLIPPHGTHNPGGFDVQRWMFIKGLRASGYVVARDSRNKQYSDAHTAYCVDHLREQLASFIQHALQHSTDWKPLAAIITALVIGSRNSMSVDEWQVFQNTGTSHLIAISGLHIGLVATAIYFLFNFLWSRSAFLVRRFPAPRAAACASIIAACIYSVLAGFSLPTQRAIVMIGVVMLGQVMNWTLPVWQRLLLAFFLILLWEPFSVYSASFWLSFFAVGWIAYVMGGRLHVEKGWRGWLRIQTALFLGLLPITLWFFQRASLAMFPANLVAIPWISLLIVPAALIACILYGCHHALGIWAMGLVGKLLWPLWWTLKYLAALPHVVFWHAVTGVSVLIASVGAVFILLLPRGWPYRWLGLFWLLPLFFSHPNYPAKGSLRLTMLDVGQGLSAVLQTAHHVLVFDTGPSSPTGYDAGKAIVVPYLLSRSIRTINALVVSHGDNDHIGGAASIAKLLNVRRILTSVPSRFKQAHVVACHVGEHWMWDGVSFTILSPQKGQPYQDNNSSCVLRVVAGAKSVLLTGDIERPTEQVLVQDHASLQATILQAPHHGSRTSSSQAFISAVSPSFVVFPIGYCNRYHFPSKQVVLRYRQEHAKLLNSARDGAVTFDLIPGQPVHVTRYYLHNRYWQR